MSGYLVLARKYRPRHFKDVVGQEVVTRVLTGALQEGRISHAYLFSGPRGTGKTTLARILAKCLNCESGPTADPCGTCERCQAADSGSEVDIIELDAASHTGVDTIRELREEAIYAPMRARNKVYIVDEVHMLSKGAFNALLKILEEPPSHVVFLFATTEPHKVLDTILSRCQVLRLSPLPEEKIKARLEEVFEHEGVNAEAGVTHEIARNARGGMRDALSLADEMLALAGNEPKLEDLERLGGDGGARRVFEILAAVENGQRAGVLEALGEGAASAELLGALLGALRQSLLAVHCGADSPLFEGTEEERELALERGQRVGSGRIELWMQELLRARERLRLFPGQERVVLEVVLLDLCRAEETLPLDELVQRLENLELRLAGEGPAATLPPPAAREATARPPSAAPRPVSKPGPGPAATAPAPPPASPGAASRRPAADAPAERTPEELMKTVAGSLDTSHGAWAALLRERAKLSLSAAGGAVVRIEIRTSGEERLAGDRRNRAAFTRALKEASGRELELEWDLGGQPAEKETASEKPKKDEFTQGVADLFGGVIEDLS